MHAGGSALGMDACMHASSHDHAWEILGAFSQKACYGRYSLPTLLGNCIVFLGTLVGSV